MIELYVKCTSMENMVAQAVAKGIVEGLSGAFAVVAAKENQRCYHCGDIEHFINYCPDYMFTLEDGQRGHQWLRSNPNALWQSGNGQQSVRQPCTMTPNAWPCRSSRPTCTSNGEQGEQFPHGPKVPAHKVPPSFEETEFTWRYRWEPATNW